MKKVMKKIGTMMLAASLVMGVCLSNDTVAKAYSTKDSLGKALVVKSFHNKSGTGDCTMVLAGNNRVVIDAGMGKKNDKSSILNLTKNKKFIETTKYKKVKKNKYVRDKVFVVDYLVITHTHSDHVNGLGSLVNFWNKKEVKVKTKKKKKYYENRKVLIKNLHYNGVYIGCEGGNELQKNEAKALLTSFMTNPLVTIQNLYVYPAMNANNQVDSWTKDVFDGIVKNAKNPIHIDYMFSEMKSVDLYGTNTTLLLVPSQGTYTGDAPAFNVNESSLSAIVFEKSRLFKFIFPGDMGGKSMTAINAGTNGQGVKGVFSGIGYNKVFIKAPHHGKSSKFGSYKKQIKKFYLEIVKPTWIVGTIWNGTNKKAVAGLNYYKALVKKKKITLKKAY